VRGDGHCCASGDCPLSVAVCHISVSTNSQRARTRTNARVDILCCARHGLEQRVSAQRIKVCACEVKRAIARDARKIKRRIKTELARERLEDPKLREVRIADAEVEHAVEAAWAQEGGVEQVGAVRRADDEDVAGGRGGRDAVELGE
jgi:hypothetical protein